jgi:colicin import membrane protein
MARKLKVYETSQGFYDLAIAAPSMKAALEAWGAGSNLFHQGFAKESEDEKAIAAAMEKPGVVLQRPVGSDAPFEEHSDLPTAVSLDAHSRKAKAGPAKAKTAKTAKAGKTAKADEKSERRAAAAFEKERARREKQRQKEEAAAAKARAKRKAAREATEAVLERAAREHEKKAAQIGNDLATVQRRADAEEERWEKLKDRLEAAVRKAGS